jgi:predicted short-subunit dehydrogenase-like oxidoreductase (DUF2520 family)
MVEGDDRAAAVAADIVESGFAGRPVIRLDRGSRRLYHAAAATAANLLVAVIDVAIEMAAAAGIAPETARQMLVRLARTSLENLASSAPGAALSGPVARGDEATLEAHREVLAGLDTPEILQIYEVLTRRLVAIADRDPSTG